MKIIKYKRPTIPISKINLNISLSNTIYSSKKPLEVTNPIPDPIPLIK
jgi:hypothetical protein